MLKDISAQNSEFWNDLCGSQLAKSLGITDSSPESLRRYDDWYMNFYPYLNLHIPRFELRSKKVLEIGLGYGTVSQWLTEGGADYTGLDIAEGPVRMVNQRLAQANIRGRAIQGNVLNAPFEDEFFDAIVAIGSLHHTGNLQSAIDQCMRMLKPNGALHFMVYSAYSYRRFSQALNSTLIYFIKELLGHRGVVGISRRRDRASYDINSEGSAAPHTDWISRRSLRYLCREFKTFVVRSENISNEYMFRTTRREDLLLTAWPQIVGLDLYAHAIK